jgi:hypothetical protein
VYARGRAGVWVIIGSPHALAGAGPVCDHWYRLTAGRYSPLQDSDTVAHYTILPRGCSPAALAAARGANDPVVAFQAGLRAAAKATAAVQAAMTVRLDASKALIQSLRAAPPARITLPGLETASEPLWLGGDAQPACYELPINVHPKRFRLSTASGGSYPGGLLGGAGGILPAAAAGCVAFKLPRLLGAGRYTLAAVDGASGNFLAGVSFAADVLTVNYVGVSLGAGALRLTVHWSVPARRASPRDTIKIIDLAGKVVFSFTTSRAVAGSRGSAVPAGSHTFTLKRTHPPSPRGGFTAKMYPDGGAIAADTAREWIPWARLGW